MLDREQKPHGGWCLRLLLAGVLVLTSARAGTPEYLIEAQTDGTWREGKAVRLAVREGRSTFQIPARGANAQTLVVVSALSRSPGPFPIQMKFRPVAVAIEPKIEVPEPARPARLMAHTGEALRPPRGSMPPADRDFHMMVRDGDVTVAGNYVRVRGVLRAIGQRVQIYVAEADVDAVSPAMLSDVVSTFDDHIVPASCRTLGLADDVDGDGRFTVLFSRWLSRLGDGRHAVDGFVRVTDLDPAFAPPFGNRCDMMYLSTSLKPGPHLRTVLAHEYMHSVVFSKKVRACARSASVPIEEEGWLDEALAHLFEDQVGFSRSNIDYRVSAYLSQPERYQLVVEDYYAADLFRSHGNRGSTYLFLRWCVDEYGPELVPALVGSSLRGIDNLQAATGVSFRELYRRWSVSQFLGAIRPEGGNDMSGAASRLGTDAGPDTWPLAGPRFQRLQPGGPPDRWEATGTSSHFVVLPGTEAGGVEVDVEGPVQADLQVTAVPLPEDLGQLQITVRPVTGSDGELTVRAMVRHPGAQPVRLRTLTWEPLVPPADPHTPGFRLGRLDEADLEPVLGSLTLSPAGTIQSRTIVLSGVHSANGPVVVKLLGTDVRGRRLTGWALVEGTTAARPLATHISSQSPGRRESASGRNPRPGS